MGQIIRCSLLGQDIDIEVIIESNLRVIASFSFLGRLYTFVISEWMGHKFTRFASTIDEMGSSTMTTEERIICSVKDVIEHLDQILKTHQRSVLGYAVWYRDNRKAKDTYAQYIQSITCQCIIDNRFTNGQVEWNEVEFTLY